MKQSHMLVLAQFSLIIAITFYAPLWSGWIQNIFVIIGLVLGIWAIVHMNFKVSVFPDAKKGQKLIMKGPYTYVRHPMYTSVLLITYVWTLNRFDVITVTLWILLLITLLVKIRYEEEQLQKYFRNYSSYTAKTKRLIPFLF